jgi:hypothetical protein
LKGSSSQEIIHAVLVRQGFERTKFDVGTPPRYEGTIAVLGKDIRVAFVVPCFDFTLLPKIILLDRSQLLGLSAHIEQDGSICYVAPGSIVLDRYDPAGTILTILTLAARTLESILDGSAAQDVPAEFPQHWGKVRIAVALPPDADDGLAQVATIFRGLEPHLFILTRGGLGLEAFPPPIAKMSRDNAKPAWLLRVGTHLDMPRGVMPPENLEQLLSWAESVERGLSMRIVGAIDQSAFVRDMPVIFFIASNGCVGAGLHVSNPIAKGFQRHQYRNKYLLKHPQSIDLIRWLGYRIDANFILQRNLGGDPSLAGRRIVLI